MADNREIAVSVTCTAYNHKPYIRNTLDHFVNQRTNFRFEVIVHDDASTDGTAEIIAEYAEKYPDIVVPVLQKENQFSKGVVIRRTFINPIVRGKYIAMCEGDDFWPDLDKLQKQYDFLEAHSDCAAVAGLTRYFNDDGIEVMSPKPEKKYLNRYMNERDYFRYTGANIATNTLMFRTEVYFAEALANARKESVIVGDIITIIQIFDSGKLYVMDGEFQHHTKQTRKNASNYNSIFDLDSKFEHVVQVVNAVYRNYDHKHDLSPWYFRSAGPYYWNCLKNGKKDTYLKFHNRLLDPRCKVSPTLVLFRQLWSMAKSKINSK